VYLTIKGDRMIAAVQTQYVMELGTTKGDGTVTELDEIALSMEMTLNKDYPNYRVHLSPVPIKPSALD
jgi:hypothetical protein